MRNYKESKLINDQMVDLEEELQVLLNEAEKILDYQSEDINEIVEDLLSLNTEESISLATNIMEIEEDILLTEEYYFDVNEEDIEDPFDNLYDEDSE